MHKSLSNPSYIGGFESGLHIPVKFHLVVDDNGDIATNIIGNNVNEHIHSLLKLSNVMLRSGWTTFGQNAAIPTTQDCGFQLYMKDGINIIPNSTINNGNRDDNASDYFAMQSSAGNFDYGAINVYLVNSISGNTAAGTLIGGFATVAKSNTPKENAFRIYLNSTSLLIGDPAAGMLFLHEVGHALGLLHTFAGIGGVLGNNDDADICFQEAADITRIYNCPPDPADPYVPPQLPTSHFFGDRIADTRGDIARTWNSSDIDASGVYNMVPIQDRLRDKHGDVWAPPVFNFMSYASDDYTRVFSPLQLAKMHGVINSNQIQGFKLQKINSYVDLFEPDNLDNGDIPIDYLNLGLGGIVVNIKDNNGVHFADHKMLPNNTYLRGMHRLIHGNEGAANTYSYVDNDIMIIEAYHDQIIEIKTESVGNGNDPDLILEYLDASDGSVVTSTNSGYTNESLIVELTGTPTSPNLHYFRIKSTGNTVGEYSIGYEVLTNCSVSPSNPHTTIITPADKYSIAFSYEAFVPNISENRLETTSYPIYPILYRNHDYYVNGSLLISSNDYIGLVDENQDSEIDGADHVPLDVTFCNSLIDVGSSGRITVGSKSTASNSTLRIGDGSILKLNGSSEILLRNSSTLIIEEGGELDLVGSNVKLDICETCSVIIKGKLKLEANSKLTHNTNGWLSFDQDIPIINGSYDLASFYEYDPSSSIEIIGNPNTGVTPKVSVNRPFYLKGLANQYPSGLTMNNALVYLNTDAFIYSFSQTTIDNCTFDAYTPNPNGHLGLRIYGNPALNIVRNSEFKNGNVGIHAQWLGNHVALRILDNTFSTTTGLKLESGKFEVSRNIFDASSHVECIGLQGTSEFDHNNFDGGGIYLHGSNNTYALLDHNTFKNGQTALIVEQLTARLNCNEFRTNDKAIDIIGSGGVVADDNASNYFFNNTISINFSDPNSGNSASLFLKDGNNEFLLGPGQQNKLHINGAFDLVEDVPNSLFTSTFAANGDLDVDNNYFEYSTTTCLPGMPCPPSGYYSVMPVSIKVYENRGMPNQNLVADIQLDISNNAADINAICDNGIIGGAEFPVLNYIQGISSPTLGGVVNTYGKNLKTLLVTQAQNISFGNFVAADLQTLDTLQTILESGITGGDVSTAELLDITYELMLTALENCYTLGHLSYTPSNITGPLHAELSRSIALIDSQLVVLDPADSSDMPLIFKFNLDKAMSYRNGAFYSHALAQLASRSSWSFSTTDVNRSNYWDCIVRAEHDVLTGTIDEEEYTLVRSGCEATYAGFTYKDNPGNELDPGYLYNSFTSQEVKFNVYPNPAVDKFNIDIAFRYDEITLSSQSGLMVREYRFENGHSYPLKGLAPGVYIVTVKGVNDTEYHSLLIIE